MCFLTPIFDRNRNPIAPLTFSQMAISDLLDKIEARANFKLDGGTEIAQGIVPNPDVVTTRSLNLIPAARRGKERLKVGDGVFVVSAHKFQGKTNESHEWLKPLFEPSDVERYTIVHAPRKCIIYSVRNRDRDDTPPKPIMDHLGHYKEIMQARRETLSGRIAYYHLHWPRDERFFSAGPKILAVRKCSTPTFAYAEREAYVMMAFNVIKSSRI